MKRKMFSILTSSALLLQGMSFPVFAHDESKFEPMEEVEALIETESSSNGEDVVTSGNLGDSSVTWKVDENGTLIIGKGTFVNNNDNFS